MNPAKIKKILAISAISCLMVFAINSTASAAFEYKMLEGLPGFYQKGADMPDLPDLILSIYKFGIWTVGIAGILMITVGGVMYMGSAGNNATAQSAKKIITDSLIGIVAALTAYLFLYVINPDLVKINLSNLIKVDVTEDDASKETTKDSTTKTTDSTASTAKGTMTHSEAKAKLAAAGIDVKNNLCTKVTDSNCTTLEGVPSSAVDNLVNLKKACGISCNIYVTGGTEGGHSSHGVGKSSIDLRTDQSTKNFLLNNKNNLSSYGIKQICTTDADASLRYNCNYKESAAHYHISFSS